MPLVKSRQLLARRHLLLSKKTLIVFVSVATICYLSAYSYSTTTLYDGRNAELNTVNVDKERLTGYKHDYFSDEKILKKLQYNTVNKFSSVSFINELKQNSFGENNNETNGSSIKKRNKLLPELDRHKERQEMLQEVTRKKVRHKLFEDMKRKNGRHKTSERQEMLRSKFSPLLIVTSLTPTQSSDQKTQENSKVDEQTNKTLTASGLKWPVFDRSRRVWSTWSGGPCKRYTVHFTAHALPCALASYPGSGNTWMRYLLEAATGVHTGSIYSDDMLYINGYRGEMENWRAGTTLLQKVHEYAPQNIASFKGTGVLLLRNPYRAVLAYHNFLFGGHKGYAPVSHFSRADWVPFLHVQIKSWLLTAVSWLQQAPRLALVHYEDLSQDPGPPLMEVMTFLGLETNEARLNCIKEHNTGHFKRVKEYLPESVKLFSIEIRDKFDRAIRYVDSLSRRRGLTPLPLDLYEFYNGTISNQIVRIPCPSNQTSDKCNYYIDELNRKLRYSSSTKSTSPPSPNFSTPQLPIYVPPQLAPTGDGVVIENTRLSIMESIFQSSMGSSMSDVFIDLVQQYTPDPVQAIMKSSDLPIFLAAPVPVEGLQREETRQLLHDYVWKDGQKPRNNNIKIINN